MFVISGRTRNSSEQQLYRLTGVVIHSGQAQAGHYYSIIKDGRLVALLFLSDKVKLCEVLLSRYQNTFDINVSPFGRQF